MLVVDKCVCTVAMAMSPQQNNCLYNVMLCTDPTRSTVINSDEIFLLRLYQTREFTNEYGMSNNSISNKNRTHQKTRAVVQTL
jgi:hypothetical protein